MIAVMATGEAPGVAVGLGSAGLTVGVALGAAGGDVGVRVGAAGGCVGVALGEAGGRVAVAEGDAAPVGRLVGVALTLGRAVGVRVAVAAGPVGVMLIARVAVGVGARLSMKRCTRASRDWPLLFVATTRRV
jgi:hypothetical protein